MISLSSPHPGAKAVAANFFGVERRRAGPRTLAASYRCAGCADEVTFNSLAMSCRCVREFYAAATPVLGGETAASR